MAEDLKSIGLKAGYRYSGLVYSLMISISITTGAYFFPQNTTWPMFNVKTGEEFLAVWLAWTFIAFALYSLVEILNPTKYKSCPHCNKSVLVNEKWQCDKCNHFQKTVRLICLPCDECGRFLETANCEHCHKEFKI